MNTIKTARAAVTGAEHRRLDRPGQDAAATLVGPGVGVAVVCDGCGSTPAAQVGAELGARLFAHAIRAAVAAGASPADAATWGSVRAAVAARLGAVAVGLGEDPAAAIHDLFLFTVVAAAVTPELAAVYAIGDGRYLLDGAVRTLGPFADNRPPYLGYDLLCEPRAAVLATAPACRAGVVAVATDGATPLDLAALATDPRFTAHPDALRRHLAVRARTGDSIDWAAQRIAREPALLQDDCAIALVRWEAAP
jgi:hypothetical protein